MENDAETQRKNTKKSVSYDTFLSHKEKQIKIWIKELRK